VKFLRKTGFSGFKQFRSKEKRLLNVLFT